jgi:hypothetical protein
VIVRHGPDLLVHCAGGGSLQVLAADLDGARLDAQSFTTHFGTGPVPLQEPA